MSRLGRESLCELLVLLLMGLLLLLILVVVVIVWVIGLLVIHVRSKRYSRSVDIVLDYCEYLNGREVGDS